MYDVIIVGLGAMGSAAAYHLSKKGVKVLGLETFTAAHDKGSSHGETRIIRQAYWEHPVYVPLILRAYELWEKLQDESRQDFLKVTGGIAIGSSGSALIQGCLRSARLHGLPYELLSAVQVKRRFPQFSLAHNECAVFEPTAGYLRPERCVEAHLAGARASGADLRFEEEVVSWTASESGVGVRVMTRNRTYEARSLVMSVGAWSSQMLAQLNLPLSVLRKVVFWITPSNQTAAFDQELFPIFLWAPEGEELFYGFPKVDPIGCPKVAVHSGGEECTPDTINKSIRPQDVEQMRSLLKTRIPELAGKLVKASTCMYTMTPDEHFIIDLHPRYQQVSIAAGFSGHGFKFSSVVGEILCDLVLSKKTRWDLARFSGSRFWQ